MSYQADYQLSVTNPNTGEILDVLPATRFSNLTYTRLINDFGKLSFTIESDDNLAQYKGVLDLIVDVYRRNDENSNFAIEGSFLIRYFNQFVEEETQDEYIVFGGVGLEDLLGAREILIQDDPLNADGFSTKFAAGSTVMLELVTDQIIAPFINAEREFAGFTANDDPLIGFDVFQRLSGGNLLDILKECALKSVIDFRIAHNGSAAVEFITERIGTDRTYTTNYPLSPFILFDPRRNNMINPSLTIDRTKEKTVCYVLGQGANDDRYIFPVVVPAAGDSIWNRRETTTDARNNENADTDGLQSAGLEALDKAKAEIIFDFTPNTTINQLRYNIDWFLGDRVTGNYGNYQQDYRIMQISVAVNENGETVTPTLEKVIN